MGAKIEDIAIPPVEIFFAVLLTFLGISAAIGNLLSIYIFGTAVKISNKNAGYISRLVFINLAITDLINGFICIPFTIYLIIQGREFPIKKHDGKIVNEVICFTVGFTFNVVSRTSIFLITAMSVERFVALFYPTYYKTKIKSAIKLIRVYVIGSWGASIILSILPLFYGKLYIYIKKQLRCTYEISSLANNISEKLSAFVIIQILPTYIPFIIMVTTSISVYVQIRKSIDKKRLQLCARERILSSLQNSSINKNSGTTTSAKKSGTTTTAARISIVFVEPETPSQDDNEAFIRPSPPCGESCNSLGSTDMLSEPDRQSSSVENEFERSDEHSVHSDTALYVVSQTKPTPRIKRSTSDTNSDYIVHSVPSKAISAMALPPGPTSEDILGILSTQSSPDLSQMHRCSTAPNSRRPSASMVPCLSGGNIAATTSRPTRLSVSGVSHGSLNKAPGVMSNMTRGSKTRSIRRNAEKLMRRATSRLRRKECKTLERRKRGAMTVLLMVVLFIVCYCMWLIIFAWIFVGLVDKRLRYRKYLNDQQILYMLTLFPVGAFINSGINPYIYYTRNSKFKDEFDRIKENAWDYLRSERSWFSRVKYFLRNCLARAT